MSNFSRRSLLKLGASAASILAAPALVRPAFAGTTSVTVASLLGEDKPETKVWRFFAARCEERLPGRFRFNVVTNGALGGEKQVAESARLGSVDAGLSTVSALTGWVPALQLLDLPFLFRDAGHLAEVVSGPVGTALADQLAEEQFIVGGFIDYGARNLLTKEPVTRPDQLDGVKIRVINSPLHTKLWESFGAVPVGIPITETYNALGSGLADAMDLTKSAYAGFRLYEVVPFMTETAHIRASGVIYFSAAFWNRLSPEEQAVFAEIGGEAAAHFNQLIVEDEAASVALAEENGATFLVPENYASWQAGARSVWSAFAPVVGGMERIETIAGD